MLIRRNIACHDFSGADLITESGYESVKLVRKMVDIYVNLRKGVRDTVTPS
jgi:hypothetical protein